MSFRIVHLKTRGKVETRQAARLGGSFLRPSDEFCFLFCRTGAE